MKKLFLLLLITHNLFSRMIDFGGMYGLYCPNEIEGIQNLANKNLMYEFYGMTTYKNRPYASNEISYDSYFAWTPESALCGGSANYSLLHGYEIDWDVTGFLMGGVPTVSDNFKNNVNVYSVYPCLSENTFSVKLYEDYYNPQYALDMSLKLIRSSSPYADDWLIEHTLEEADYIRNYCNKPDYDLKPLIDDLEQINLDIKSQIQALNENSNLYNKAYLDELINIKNELLKESLIENSNSQNPSLNNLVDKELDEMEDLNNIANDYEDTSSDDLFNSINSFNTEYQSSLESVFSSYSDVFGFGGYGVAPQPITLQFWGKTYKFLDVSTFEKYIPTMRNTLLSFSYLWGFIFFIRGIK